VSHHLVNLAWQKDLPHAPKIVLLALADFAMLSTGECFPSVRVLSAKCGLSASAVRSQLQRLHLLGLIDVEPNLYRVKLGVVA
jgi:DNA-binding IclR family transcriptional regulator